MESGLPDWVEEQRAIRAFWRIHLFYDLKQAVSTLPWPEDDITALHKMQPMQMYHDVDWRVGRSGDGEVYPEYQEIYSVFDYVRDAHGENSKRVSAFKPVLFVQGEVRREWPAPAPGTHHWAYLSYTSGACPFFVKYRKHGKAFTKFEWLRRWGFAFWSWRMCDAGFYLIGESRI